MLWYKLGIKCRMRQQNVKCSDTTKELNVEWDNAVSNAAN